MRGFMTGAILALGPALLALTSCKGEPVEFAIFSTGDIRLQLHSPKADPFGLGGIARLATKLKERRAAYPPNATVTVDAGDWSEGAWHYNTDTGAAMLRLFGVLGYDAVIVGGHDALNGADRLRETIAEAKPAFPLLASNLDLSTYAGAEEFKKALPPYAVIERSGYRLGIVGLTMENPTYGTQFGPVATTDAVAAARTGVHGLRNLTPSMDAVIVVSHNSFERNVELARTVAGVDAVVSGASSRRTPKIQLVKNGDRSVPVIEVGQGGAFLGELRLRLDRSKKKKISFAGYEVHPIAPPLAEDAEVSKRIEAEDARLNDSAGTNVFEVVAETDLDLDARDPREASLGDLAAKAYRDFTQAEAGMEALTFLNSRLAKGPLTLLDLHDVMPHVYDHRTGKEWTIKVWNLRGSDLSAIVNIISLTSVVALERTAAVSFDNVEVTWAPKGEGNPAPRITAVRVGGLPLDLTRRYTMALTDGLLEAIRAADQKLHLGIDFTELQETGVEGSKAIMSYGTKVKKLTEVTLRQGSRVYTTVADPAIHGYEVPRVAGPSAELQIPVTNDGLAALAAGAQVECRTGRPNDAVLGNSPENAVFPIGKASVPRLEPGERVVVRIPWRPAPGLWPLKCQVTAPVDGYAGNSSFSRIVKVFPAR